MQNTITVLFVDKDLKSFQTCKTYIDRNFQGRYNVDSEINCTKAISAMERNQYDVYVVAYKLFGMNGIDVLVEAKKRGCTGPIIISTNMENPEIDLEALEAGADDLVRKNSSDAQLIEKAIRFCFERKRNERFLSQRQLEFAQALKLATVGKMTSAVMHEINNPLTSLAGKIAQVKREFEKTKHQNQNAPLAKHLDDIEKLTIRVIKIVRGLYRFSHDSSDDPIEPVNICQVISESVEMIQPKLKIGKVKLTVDEFPSDIAIQGKALQISLALLNLINNAIDAVQIRQEKWVRISVRSTEDSVEIRVTDSGAGLSSDMKNQILKPFYSTKKKGQGLGLGLSIVKDIAEAHGGYLDIEDETSNTCFILTMKKKPKADLTNKSKRRCRVLVIDDDQDIVDMLCHELNQHGYETAQAYDGHSALVLLNKQKFDIVICDVVMPGLKGDAVCLESSKNTALHPNFLFITGQSDERLPKFLLNGEQLLLRKPFNLEKLLDITQDLCMKNFHQ